MNYERNIGQKEVVVKTVKQPSRSKDKPYELVQVYDEYEVYDANNNKTIQQRNKRQFMRTIKTAEYNKEVEVEKREEEKPSKKRAAKKATKKRVEEQGE